MEEELELHNIIHNMYRENENIHSIGYGLKTIGGVETSDYGLIFHVFEKKTIAELSPNQIIPPRVEINQQNFITDVVEERELPIFIGCYDWNPGQKVIDGCPSGYTCYNSGYLASAEQNLHRVESRPIMGGISITEYSKSPGSLGTMGLLVRDNEDNSIVALTNTHVVTSCRLDPLQNTRFYTENHLDSPVVQPAYYETWDGTPGSLPSIPLSKRIGQVKRCSFYNYGVLYFAGGATLFIDAALVHIDAGVIDSSSANIKGFESFGPLSFATKSEIDGLLTNNISLYISGRTTGAKGGSSCRISVKENMFVQALFQQKCGIDTLSSFSINFYDVLRIRYDSGDQGVVVPGDSGSVVVGDFSGIKKIVGLIFAAGGTNYTDGIFCRIDRVASEMNISAWDGTNIINSDTSKWQYLDRDLIIPDPEVFNFKEDYLPRYTIIDNGKKYWRIGSISSSSTIPPTQTPTPTPTATAVPPTATPTPTPTATAVPPTATPTPTPTITPTPIPTSGPWGTANTNWNNVGFNGSGVFSSPFTSTTITTLPTTRVVNSAGYIHYSWDSIATSDCQYDNFEILVSGLAGTNSSQWSCEGAVNESKVVASGNTLYLNPDSTTTFSNLKIWWSQT